MAFSYSFKWLSLLLAAASLITIASADRALIESICSTSSNTPQCINILKTSAVSERGALGQLLTNVALRKVHKSLNLVRQLAKTSTDNQYDTCLEVFDDAFDSLKECKKAFSENHLKDANAMASAALTDFDTCSDEVTNAPPQLTDAIKESSNIIRILLAASYDGPA
ncbi:PMEI domain-containing protein [Heracleum sosnowskyi]|uniref:PMEI domain-containing protein n=1 Tax=Heracleum sosnowskyi TaxID=360622 RepID=A0AAD8MWK2_9APIA|nr:PMEI domain-containing protein [Heracleum sosnowskyi]KAK1387446.1 PMEI domain-containing protein [Heracleum sosnowskyi]